MEILKFIFRRKTLNSILFLIAAAIIREALALGFDDDFEELFNLLNEQFKDKNGLFLILIVILKIVFSKGSYITLSILFVLLLIFVFLKYKELVLPSKFRPRIDFHKIWSSSARLIRGTSPDNPKVIRVGIDKIKRYWELNWNFEIEIRNNSSQTVYELDIEFQNKPANTQIVGSIGKYEPIQPHEKREYRFKLIQNMTGTHEDADKWLAEKEKELLKDMQIVGRYKNENRKEFKTIYNWVTDQNKHK